MPFEYSFQASLGIFPRPRAYIGGKLENFQVSRPIHRMKTINDDSYLWKGYIESQILYEGGGEFWEFSQVPRPIYKGKLGIFTSHTAHVQGTVDYTPRIECERLHGKRDCCKTSVASGAKSRQVLRAHNGLRWGRMRENEEVRAT